MDEDADPTQQTPPTLPTQPHVARFSFDSLSPASSTLLSTFIVSNAVQIGLTLTIAASVLLNHNSVSMATANIGRILWFGKDAYCLWTLSSSSDHQRLQGLVFSHLIAVPVSFAIAADSVMGCVQAWTLMLSTAVVGYLCERPHLHLLNQFATAATDPLPSPSNDYSGVLERSARPKLYAVMVTHAVLLSLYSPAMRGRIVPVAPLTAFLWYRLNSSPTIERVKLD